MRASVLERLREVAARHPDAPAVVEDDRTVTYAQFLDLVHAFAARFAQVAAPRVLIASEKSAETYAAMFATLMAGGTYAPANVAATHTRLSAIREAFEPHLVLAEGDLAAWFARDPSAQVLDPRDVPPAGAAAAGRWAPVEPTAIAYVIFTSGSTGVPKGVAIPRAALDHYVAWLGPALDIAPGDRMPQHPNIGFDLSVLDIYGALCFGAALHPFVGQRARLLPARKIAEDRLTVWNSVPSVLSAMASAGELDAAHLASVRLFTFCGEVLRADHVADLFAARPDARVMNTYGPTEATVAMTVREFSHEDHRAVCRPAAPIGAAIGEMGLHLVGETPNEGEIVITGPQLAAGYWKDAALTAEKFRDVSVDGRVVRGFYTGDYARRVGDDLYFLGRRDEMVKLRGHRVDLGEVRAAFAKLGWTSVCIYEAQGALVAVVEASDHTAFDERSLIGELARLLESYAVPAQVRRIGRLPRNANDKIDTAAVKGWVEAG